VAFADIAIGAAFYRVLKLSAALRTSLSQRCSNVRRLPRV
jgi:hypothetical protein